MRVFKRRLAGFLLVIGRSYLLFVPVAFTGVVHAENSGDFDGPWLGSPGTTSARSALAGAACARGDCNKPLDLRRGALRNPFCRSVPRRS